MSRRLTITGVLVLGVIWLTAFLTLGGARAKTSPPRVLVLGVDGMDPTLLEALLRDGRMPNFARLAASGSFSPLRTSIPPQSPVAWSNFITGAGPGTHQIYDFIHRDAAPGAGGPAVAPYLSTSTVEPPSRDWHLPFGDWRIPLFGSSTVSLRKGEPFWDRLVDHGVETTIYRVPANYPPPGSQPGFRCLCGMGTPDLLGTYGEFTFFSTDPLVVGRETSGGRFVRLRIQRGRGVGTLVGPDNFLRAPDERGEVPPLTATFDITLDREREMARIQLGDEVRLLQVGEWSDWTPVDFETELPASWLASGVGLPTIVGAMVRFYLKSVAPEVEMYVSPLNIDPMRPANPVGAPGSFAREIAEDTGRFYTTGIPEDTKALRSDALSEDEFIEQVTVLKAERLAQYRQALADFDEGFLFFYFGHVDQLSHIFWRDTDPDHPAYTPEEGAKYGSVITDAYLEMDGLLGEAMATMDDDDLVMVMSDHGFTSFRRGVNLNAWLLENGYLTLTDERARGVSRFFAGVDWANTKAYALGLNGLYINLQGREQYGVVPPAEKDALVAEIGEKLLRLTDADGEPAIDEMDVVERVHAGADEQIAPDMIVGYADTYRGSWSTAEGGIGQSIIENNMDRWSGDHCIAHRIVPGILVMNRPLTKEDPDLTDLAPTILRAFGVEPPASMTGRPLTE